MMAIPRTNIKKTMELLQVYIRNISVAVAKVAKSKVDLNKSYWIFFIIFLLTLFATMLIFKKLEKPLSVRELQEQIELYKQPPALVFAGDTLESGLKKLEDRINEDRIISDSDANIIKEEISDMKQQIAELKETLSGVTDNIKTDVEEMQQEVSAIHEVTSAKAELSTSELPFSVISIDQWNGQPLLAIQMNGRSDLISRQESRMGWKLIDINVNKKFAVFINDNKQIIKVAL